MVGHGGGMTVRFERVTLIDAPRARVFDLSLRVDLHTGSMSRYRERVVGEPPERLAMGDTVTWRAWHMGLPWTMTSRIIACVPPAHFVDEQTRGPFAAFRHAHHFEECDGGTRMTDVVEFRAPGGPLGRLAERLILDRRLRRLIDERNSRLRAVAEGRV